MMQSTGIQTPVGIKVKGPDVAVIEEISQQIEGLLRGLPGTKSVIAERISEGYYVDVRNDLRAHGRARRHRGRGDVDGALRASAATTSSASSRRTTPSSR